MSRSRGLAWISAGCAAALLLAGLVTPGFSVPVTEVPTWQPAVAVSAAGRSATNAQVTVDRLGTAYLVWQRFDGHDWRVQFARRPAGESWTAPVTLSTAGQDAYRPDVAVGGGTVVVVWTRYDRHQVLRVQAASRPAGGRWTTPVTLSTAGRDARVPHVAIDRQGTAVVVWADSDGELSWILTASRAAGGVWSSPATLSAVGYGGGPDIAVGGGIFVAAWRGSTTDWFEIAAARRTDRGAWDKVRLVASYDYADYPEVAVDREGAATVAWFDATDDTWIEAATWPAGGRPTSPVTVSDAGADFPGLAVDRQGTVVVVWQGYDPGPGSGPIRAAARPAEGTWSSPLTVSQAGEDARVPDVAVDGQGTVVVAWVGTSGDQQRIQAASRPSEGAWGTPVVLSTAARETLPPRVAAAGPTSVAVWERRGGSGKWRVQAAVLEATGTTLVEGGRG